MPTLRIVLADDHAVVREGIKALINAQPTMEVVGEAADGRNACQLAETLRPDVAVLDISMPEICGAEATGRLRRQCPAVKVLALTVHEHKSYLRLLLEAGARGYLLKRAAAEELVHAIRTVAAGGVYVDPSLAGQLVGGLVRRCAGHALSEGNDLSEREADVVRLIASGHSNKEIAAQLGLSVKTVETYKGRSLEKLGVSSRADLVRYALQRGWLQTG
jgi:DNA-binding NarL/FixJ family response regulator